MRLGQLTKPVATRTFGSHEALIHLFSLSIIHDYFDKVLSRKGAAPATGRDTLIKLQGRVARKLDTHDSENMLAGLPS